MLTITEIVKEFSNRYGISQNNLARMLDVGTNTVVWWKKHKAPVMAEVLLRLMLDPQLHVVIAEQIRAVHLERGNTKVLRKKNAKVYDPRG